MNKKVITRIQNNSMWNTFAELYSKSLKWIFGLIFMSIKAFVSCI